VRPNFAIAVFVLAGLELCAAGLKARTTTAAESAGLKARTTTATVSASPEVRCEMTSCVGRVLRTRLQGGSEKQDPPYVSVVFQPANAGVQRDTDSHQAENSRIGITVAARAQQPGEVVVLTLTSPDAPHVVAFGRTVPVVPVGPQQFRALIGIDLDATPGSHRVTITAGSGERHVETMYQLVVKPRRFPTRRLEVDEAFVNPPPGARERIEREAQQLARLWEQSAPEALWTGRFIKPVPDRANSSFGTRSIFNGVPRSPHSGTDFLSPAGTPIKAPNAGRVMLAADLYFSGNTIVVDHGLGVVSLFAHLSTFAVHEGQLVETGQMLGAVGATGRVTGAHLHWALHVNGARVDPLSLVAALGETDR